MEIEEPTPSGKHMNDDQNALSVRALQERNRWSVLFSTKIWRANLLEKVTLLLVSHKDAIGVSMSGGSRTTSARWR